MIARIDMQCKRTKQIDSIETKKEKKSFYKLLSAYKIINACVRGLSGKRGLAEFIKIENPFVEQQIYVEFLQTSDDEPFVSVVVVVTLLWFIFKSFAIRV